MCGSKMPTARGVLILDETLDRLRSQLEEKNFKVYRVASHMTDEQIAPLLAHRVFVTNNPDQYRELAAIHEFSIIHTGATSKDPASVAQQISRVWIDESLRARQPFYARLLQDGSVVISDIS